MVHHPPAYYHLRCLARYLSPIYSFHPQLVLRTSPNGMWNFEPAAVVYRVRVQGQSLAVGASDGTVRLLDLRNEKETSQPVAAYGGSKAPPGGVRQVEFQPSHSTRPSALLRSNSNPRGAVVNGDDTVARASSSANGGSGGTSAAEGRASSSSAAVAHHRGSSRTSARSSDSRSGQVGSLRSPVPL